MQNETNQGKKPSPSLRFLRKQGTAVQSQDLRQNIENFSDWGQKRTHLRMGVFWASVLMMVFVALLVLRLFNLQVVKGNEYKRLAALNHYKRTVVYPERGKIQDANGEILAMTTYVYTVGVTPEIVKSNLSDFSARPTESQIAERFAEILQMDLEQVRQVLSQKSRPYVQLAKHISKEKYEALRAYTIENRIGGLTVDVVDQRYYPMGRTASAIIGYTSRPNQWLSGVIGLEKEYNKELAGEIGYSFGEVDHFYGSQLPYSNGVEKPAVEGRNLVLNMNLELQHQVQTLVERYAELYDAQEGAGAIVMNAKTGQVVAMAQSNNFDLNNPLAKPTQLLAVDDDRVAQDRAYKQKKHDESLQNLEEYYLGLQKELEDEKESLQSRIIEYKKDLLNAERETENYSAQTVKSLEVQISDMETRIKEIDEKVKALEEEHRAIVERLETRFQEDMRLTALPDPDDWNPNEHVNDMYFLNNRVWQNVLISTPYEPGSTMKTFTVAAGLEEHVISQTETFADAPIKIPGWEEYPIACWSRPSNHGYETVEEALGNSCNPVMVQIAERLGIEKFHRYIKALGFYDYTKIDLPFENVGIVHRDLSFVDMATLSFGEQNTITPIQVATAYTSITNNGVMMRPQIVKYITDKSGRIYKEFAPTPIRQVFSAETADRMLAMLRAAVLKGAVTYADAPGYQVGAKSGTSTKLTNESVEADDGSFDDNYSVQSVAAVFPVSDPQYIVLTYLQNPRTVFAVAPQALARDIIRETGRVMDVKKIYAPGDVEKLLTPQVLQIANSVTLTSIADYLVRRGFTYEMEEGLSPRDMFYNSYPPSGTTFNGYPILYISRDGSPPKEEIEVPDFSGLTFIQAAELARTKRVNLVYYGEPELGRVVRQSVPVYKEDGSANKMTPFSVINLTFEAKEGENVARELSYRSDPVAEPDIDVPIRYLFERQTISDWTAATKGQRAPGDN